MAESMTGKEFLAGVTLVTMAATGFGFALEAKHNNQDHDSANTVATCLATDQKATNVTADIENCLERGAGSNPKINKFKVGDSVILLQNYEAEKQHSADHYNPAGLLAWGVGGLIGGTVIMICAADESETEPVAS
ncbi:MAG: hypothetical protein JWN38_321 [Candidatus Saccharibacteria bacterium]|nr:hypothetical protein [Candidatus Saccharibacteria bacterium]